MSEHDAHTIDAGYVHVLTEPGGPCVDNCPHPSHLPPEEHDHEWTPCPECPNAERPCSCSGGACQRCPIPPAKDQP